MLIVTCLYLLLVWLLFFKFKWQPWSRANTSAAGETHYEY